MSTALEWLNNCLDDIDHDIFKDVVNITGEVQPIGDGQVVVISDIKRVNLTLETSNGKKKIIKVIAKEEMASGAGRDLAIFCGAFDTEIWMYSHVLKTMKKMLTDIEDEEFMWPECYYSGNNKFIFEDLCESGHRIVPAYKFLDLPHALLVMKGIGKFHALSMTMKEKGTLDTNKLRNPVFARNYPMIEIAYQNSIDSIVKAIRESWEPEWLPVADRLEAYMGNPSEKVAQLWQSTKGIWDVLNHGDFTLRNMLFHYPPDSSQPDGIKFVDFQISHYSHFGFDIGMLIYSSMIPSVRDENMKLLLETYAKSVETTCKQHNYAGSVPTLEDVESSLKLMNYFTTMSALFCLPFLLTLAKSDVQERADEFIVRFSEADQKSFKDMVDFKEKNIQVILKYELTRCMNENIF